jgi:plastocyanin
MIRGRTLAVACATGMLATLMVAPQARAQTTYEVGVGAFLGQDVPAEEMAFLPGRIRVHQGDTLHFTSESFHTATAIPEGTDVTDWIEDNAAEPGDPFNLFTPDLDDGPDALKYNPDVLFPSCGTPDTPPCDYDGSEVLNSGVPLEGPMDHSVAVNANPGSSFWSLCLIHPSMRMRVQVVEAQEEASNQAQIDSAVAQRLSNSHDDALALHNKMSKKRSFHRDAQGRRVWDAWAGFDTKRFSLFDMYPNKLRIAKGDRVRWHFGQLQHEVHTVSINRRQARQQILSEDFIPVCDPDGDGPGPDNPPELDGPPFCNDPTQFELEAADLLGPPVGNGAWTGGSDLEHSGVLGAVPPAPDDSHSTVRFRKTTSRKGVPYICAIHPFMVGRVRVTS